jgi:hypothetical protein
MNHYKYAITNIKQNNFYQHGINYTLRLDEATFFTNLEEAKVHLDKCNVGWENEKIKPLPWQIIPVDIRTLDKEKLIEEMYLQNIGDCVEEMYKRGYKPANSLVEDLVEFGSCAFDKYVGGERLTITLSYNDSIIKTIRAIEREDINTDIIDNGFVSVDYNKLRDYILLQEPECIE